VPGGSQRCILLRAYPQGMPRASDFELVERALSSPGVGEVLVETSFLSMDPAPRMRMNPTAREPPPLSLGDVVLGRGVGTVRESRHADYQAGDIVAGELGWQEYAVLPGAQLRKVDPTRGPIQAALGVLGPSGTTAWCLVNAAAKVRPGETVVVAAAAGSVGSIAIQLARNIGTRTIGIVGSDKQAAFVRDRLGADAVVNYQSQTLAADLAAAAPNGVNVFLDSVGGALHNAVMEQIAVHARIIAFGYISAYNTQGAPPAEYGRIFRVIHRRAELRGFLIADFVAHFGDAQRELVELLVAGGIINEEHTVDGLEQAPSAFAALFTGDPIGKQLVRIPSQ